MTKILFVHLFAILLLACVSENKPVSNVVPAVNSTDQSAPTNSNIDDLTSLGTVNVTLVTEKLNKFKVANNGLLKGLIGGGNETIKQLEKNVFDAVDELITAIRGNPGNKENGVVSELIGENFLTQFIARFLSQNGVVNVLVDHGFYKVAGGPAPKGTKGKPLNLGPLKNILGPILANDYGAFDNNADYDLYRVFGRGTKENRNEKLD